MTHIVEDIIHANHRGQRVHITILPETNIVEVSGFGPTKEEARRDFWKRANGKKRGLNGAFIKMEKAGNVEVSKGDLVPGTTFESNQDTTWWTVRGRLFWPVMAHTSQGEPVEI